MNGTILSVWSQRGISRHGGEMLRFAQDDTRAACADDGEACGRDRERDQITLLSLKKFVSIIVACCA